MKLTVAKKRSESWNENSLIPMINVVFLLLVFFMIAGTIKSLPPLAVESPESVLKNPPQGTHTLYLAADGSLAINQEPVSLIDLETRLRLLLVGAADDGLLSDEGQGAKTNARVKADAHAEAEDVLVLAVQADAAVTFEQLKSVLGKIRAAGVVELELLTMLVPTVTTER